MHIYFVRHGETLLNRKCIHQSPNTPLSHKGREQILTTAEILRGVNADLLLTSEYTRAVESARLIGSTIGIEPVVNGFIYEIMRPSNLFGKSHFHILTLWYVILSFLHWHNKNWRYKDAENFYDISVRAKKTLEYLESLKDTHTSVIVVSHTVFIHIMISYMCKKKMLHLRDLCITLFHIKRMKNASVIHMEYTNDSKPVTCAWTLLSE